jgi:hypothetical protein
MADSGDENIASTSSFNSNSKKKHRYDVRFKLEALAYAEKHSGEKAAKQFGVDSRRIREWKKQKTDLLALRIAVRSDFSIFSHISITFPKVIRINQLFDILCHSYQTSS